jgi:hypothetical protein
MTLRQQLSLDVRELKSAFGARLMINELEQEHDKVRDIDADGGGFEPPVPFGTHAFQACTIDRSVTHPLERPQL